MSYNLEATGIETLVQPKPCTDCGTETARAVEYGGVVLVAECGCKEPRPSMEDAVIDELNALPQPDSWHYIVREDRTIAFENMIAAFAWDKTATLVDVKPCACGNFLSHTDSYDV